MMGAIFAYRIARGAAAPSIVTNRGKCGWKINRSMNDDDDSGFMFWLRGGVGWVVCGRFKSTM